MMNTTSQKQKFVDIGGINFLEETPEEIREKLELVREVYRTEREGLLYK